MPLEGIFIEPSSTNQSLPDLSLHISLPNQAPDQHKSNPNISSSSSIRPQAYTELSLSTTTSQQQQQQQQQPYDSDRLRPIKGIPVYQNHNHRPFPFISHPPQHPHVDPKMCFYTSPSTSSLDPMSIFNNASSYRATTPRTFVSMEPFKSSHHHNYGVGLVSHHHHHEAASSHHHHHHHGMMRSKFLPKLPSKRSMRAPRMRWTSTLHARFVHAVELLGGHERMFNFYLFFNLKIN